MGSFYPPVLDNQAYSIPYSGTSDPLRFYEILFKMPGMNNIGNLVNNGHIQVILKTQSNNQPAVNPIYSPDNQVIYFNAMATYNGVDRYLSAVGDGIWSLKLPYPIFADGKPKMDTKYTCQVRFGDTPIWMGPGDIGPLVVTFAGFAPWRQAQMTNVPSTFGEWSNVQSVYCQGAFTQYIDYNYDDFVPEIVYTYNTVYNDPIVQAKVLWYWGTVDGVEIQDQVFNGSLANDNSFELRCKLPIAPFEVINVSLEAVTANNSIVGSIIDVAPITYGNNFAIENGNLRDYPIVGEEINDGILAKELIPPPGARPGGFTGYNVYRTNILTLATIKAGTQIDPWAKIVGGVPVAFRDYSVEMGEDYQYIVCGTYNGKCETFLFSPLPFGFDNIGYGRLMRMDSSYLVSRWHQLRLQGNVKVNQFQRVTQDQFQTTLGSQYPFYARNANINYRQMTISALVSINFDPTATFMRLDYNTQIFQSDLNGDAINTFDSIREAAEWILTNTGLVSDLATVEYRIKRAVNGEIANAYGYLWSRGTKNGLWWDEDENNRTFQVMDRDIFGNIQYSLSRRRTAQGNNVDENMIFQLGNEDPSYTFGAQSIYSQFLNENITKLYGTDKSDSIVFVERKFREWVMKWMSDGKPKLFRSETEGNMIVIATQVSFTPFERSDRIVYTMNCTLTEVAEYNLENLIFYNIIPIAITPNYEAGSEYIFYEGDADHNLSRNLAYIYNKAYDTPNTLVGQFIGNINTLPAVYYGTPKYTFSIASGPTWLSIDPDTGVLSGSPPAASPATIATLRVIDSEGSIATMDINVGVVYSELQFDSTNPIYTIPSLTTGTQISVPLNQYAIGPSGGMGPYRYGAMGLPPGLTINRNTGEIYGAPSMNVAGGIFQVQCMDAIGQAKYATVQFGQFVYPLNYEDSPTFNLPYTEVGTAMIPIDTSGAVSGGHPDITMYPVNGYQFYDYDPNAGGPPAHTLPAGITINQNTGIISGTPTAASPAGISTLWVQDGAGATDSITITYSQVLARFTFAYFAYNDIPDLLFGTYFNQDKTNVNYNFLPQVSGGLPFSYGSPYKFRADGLLPNYDISIEGIITGYAQLGLPAHRATIYVRDARNIEIPIGTAANLFSINVGNINTGIIFPDDPAYDIPPLMIGAPAVTRYIGYNLTQRISGGAGPYTWTVTGLPPGFTATPRVDLVNGFQYLEITGSPTGPVPASTFVVTVTDSSLNPTTGLPDPQQASIQVSYGGTPTVMNWVGNFTVPNLPLNGALIPEVALTGITGGLGPYTITVDAGLPAPLSLINYGDANNPNRGRIGGYAGAVQVMTGRSCVVTVRDAVGQTVQKTIPIGYWYPPIMINFVAGTSMPGLFLLQNFSVIDTNGEAAGGAPVQILTVTGGMGGPYTLFFNGLATPQNIIPGVQLNNNGTIQGTPTQLGMGTNIAMQITARDSAGNMGSPTPGSFWSTPNVVPPVSRTDGQPWATAFPTGMLLQAQNYTSPVLFNMNGNQLDVAWGTNGVTSAGLPATLVFYQNFQINGAPQAISNTPINASVSVRTLGNIYTNPRTYTIPVVIARVTSFFFYTKVPQSLEIPKLQVGIPMTAVNAGAGASGGTGPYTFTITAGALPPGVTMNTANGMITGTPAAITPSYSITITATDSSNPQQSGSIQIVSPGVVAPLIFPNNPGYNIPAYAANTTIANIQIAAPTGGSGIYTFSATGITPYTITNNGLISGSSEARDFPMRNATITVFDTFEGISASITITVGAITGGYVNFIPGAGANIPNLNVGVPMAPINLDAWRYGGAAPFNWTCAPALPDGLTLDPPTGVISGTPTTPTPPGSTIVTVTSGGNAMNATITWGNIA